MPPKKKLDRLFSRDARSVSQFDTARAAATMRLNGRAAATMRLNGRAAATMRLNGRAAATMSPSRAHSRASRSRELISRAA